VINCAARPQSGGEKAPGRSGSPFLRVIRLAREMPPIAKLAKVDALLAALAAVVQRTADPRVQERPLCHLLSRVALLQGLVAWAPTAALASLAHVSSPSPAARCCPSAPSGSGGR